MMRKEAHPLEQREEETSFFPFYPCSFPERKKQDGRDGGGGGDKRG